MVARLVRIEKVGSSILPSSTQSQMAGQATDLPFVFSGQSDCAIDERGIGGEPSWEGGDVHAQ